MRPTKRTARLRSLIAPPPPAAPRAGRRSPRSRSRRPTASRAAASRPRSPGSSRIRPIAAASSSGRPGGTSRPFSPSCTTSGTPPTAVETTGTPTDSASTAECGRFSQSLESSAASAPATRAQRLVARQRAAERDPVAGARGGHARGRARARSGPSPTRTSRASGTRAIASIAVPSAFCRVSRPTKTNVPGSSCSRSTSRGGGAGFVSTCEPVAAQPQPAAISARYALGTTIVRARAQRARPQRLQRRDRGARRVLELLERAVEEAVALRPLVGGVGDELRDERPPRDAGGRDAAAAYVAEA